MDRFRNKSLIVPPALMLETVSHCQRELPIEACGLWAGLNQAVSKTYPLINEAKSATRFWAAESLFAPMKDLRESQRELLAIYHSHPNAPAEPSQRDLAENYYGDLIHVIISFASGRPTARAWAYFPECREISLVME